MSTVKPGWRTTCKQQPPVNNDWYNATTTSLKLFFYLTPLSNGPFLQVPRLVVVHRFDCYFILQKYFKNCKKISTSVTTHEVPPILQRNPLHYTYNYNKMEKIEFKCVSYSIFLCAYVFYFCFTKLIIRK